jgi:hypothetical protein
MVTIWLELYDDKHRTGSHKRLMYYVRNKRMSRTYLSEAVQIQNEGNRIDGVILGITNGFHAQGSSQKLLITLSE